MNRRTAIKNTVLLSAGTSLLISCRDNATVSLKNIPLTGSDEQLLQELTDAIIPKTEFIGARDLKAHEFVLMMVDECLGPEEQKIFVDGMKQFEIECRKRFNTRFTKSTPEQRQEFLKSLDIAQEDSGSMAKFYQTVKHLTLQQFTSSEKYLVQVRKYNMIPGDFKGCVSVVAENV